MALPFGRRPHRSDATASMGRIGRRHRDSPPGLAAAVVKRHLGNDLSKIQVRQAGLYFFLPSMVRASLHTVLTAARSLLVAFS